MRGEHRERKAPLQERAADDRSLAAGRFDGCEVGPRPYASGGKDRQPRTLPHVREQLEIGPREVSVAVDGTAEDARDAGGRAPLRFLLGGHAGPPAPSGGNDISPTDVHGHDEASGEPSRVALERAWLGEPRRPDDDPSRTRVE